MDDHQDKITSILRFNNRLIKLKSNSPDAKEDIHSAKQKLYEQVKSILESKSNSDLKKD